MRLHILYIYIFFSPHLRVRIKREKTENVSQDDLAEYPYGRLFKVQTSYVWIQSFGDSILRGILKSVLKGNPYVQIHCRERTYGDGWSLERAMNTFSI